MGPRFDAEIDTSSDRGPTLTVDGNEVPLAGYGYVETPDGVARWHFDVLLAPSEDDGELADLLAAVDPAELEAEAMARVDAYEGQAAPITRAVLAVLRDALRARP